MPTKLFNKELREKLEDLRNTLPMAQYLEMQQDVPEVLGIGKSAWYYIRSGKSRLRIEHIVPLANHLGCKPQELLPQPEHQTA